VDRHVLWLRRRILAKIAFDSLLTVAVVAGVIGALVVWKTDLSPIVAGVCGVVIGQILAVARVVHGAFRNPLNRAYLEQFLGESYNYVASPSTAGQLGQRGDAGEAAVGDSTVGESAVGDSAVEDSTVLAPHVLGGQLVDFEPIAVLSDPAADLSPVFDVYRHSTTETLASVSRSSGAIELLSELDDGRILHSQKMLVPPHRWLVVNRVSTPDPVRMLVSHLHAVNLLRDKGVQVVAGTPQTVADALSAEHEAYVELGPFLGPYLSVDAASNNPIPLLFRPSAADVLKLGLNRGERRARSHAVVTSEPNLPNQISEAEAGTSMDLTDEVHVTTAIEGQFASSAVDSALVTTIPGHTPAPCSGPQHADDEPPFAADSITQQPTLTPLLAPGNVVPDFAPSAVAGVVPAMVPLQLPAADGTEQMLPVLPADIPAEVPSAVVAATVVASEVERTDLANALSEQGPDSAAAAPGTQATLRPVAGVVSVSSRAATETGLDLAAEVVAALTGGPTGAVEIAETGVTQAEGFVPRLETASSIAAESVVDDVSSATEPGAESVSPLPVTVGDEPAAVEIPSFAEPPPVAPKPDAVKRTRTSRSVVTPINMKFEVSPVPHLDSAPMTNAPGTSDATPAVKPPAVATPAAETAPAETSASGTAPAETSASGTAPAGTRAVPVEELRQLLPNGHDHSPLTGTTIPDVVPEFVFRDLPSP